jgi:GNAT superfamily N-acetyltransferase
VFANNAIIMESGLDGLIRLQKGQIEPASEALARAFINDPDLVQFVPDEHKRAKLLPHIFRVELCYGVKHGEVYASPGMEGIAMWLPSTATDMRLWTLIRCGGLALLLKVNWRLLCHLEREEAFSSRLHKRLAPFPHWYLALLGVDPEFQGKGFASRLLKPMLTQLEAEGLPCYLETIEKYVPMYQHLGFRVIHETVLPSSGDKMWVLLKGKVDSDSGLTSR